MARLARIADLHYSEAEVALSSIDASVDPSELARVSLLDEDLLMACAKGGSSGVQKGAKEHPSCSPEWKRAAHSARSTSHKHRKGVTTTI